MADKNFTWVKTHGEITDYLKTKENSQIELIELLKSIGITPFNDKDQPGDQFIELEEIDPFTFFCYIYKYGGRKRLYYLKEIAKKINASIPSDEKGIPSAQAQQVWLFPYKYNRENKEISRLWSFFFKALNNTLVNADFEDVLTIKCVGKTKLTEALFYIDPVRYFPINGPTAQYITKFLNINPKFNSFSEYTSLLNEIRSKTDIPFYELSYVAWEWTDKMKTSLKKSKSYSEQLINFLDQAKTDNLKTKHFDDEYNGTKVKVSFGQGMSARIPWISFLKKPFTTSEGIYPVYLFYKNIDKLVLAYGVSETNKPQIEWKINNPIKIKDHFRDNSLDKPDRYGDSFVFKIYNTNNLPDKDILDSDLNEIIQQYLSINMDGNKKIKAAADFNLSLFHEDCVISGLKYSTKLITRYISSLTTKPFVLLSGLSGSGKTKLAQCFAQWICEEEKQYCIVPVGADWTNREPLLGYVNALDNNEYILPENGALELIIRANKDQDKPYFLILDEMNLSHVERYFADFLSVMESIDNFKLHSDRDNEKSGVPHEFAWPKNFFVVGTVNIDETTYMFSPKVLDRANVIEFRVDETEIESFLMEGKEITSIAKMGAEMGNSFVEIAKNSTNNNDFTQLNLELLNFFKELQKLGAEFGYRTASEIQTLFSKIDLVNPSYSTKENEKIDIAIMQKLLPKLHGSRRKLLKTLNLLAQKCLEKEQNIIFDERGVYKIEEENEIKYSLSFEKIARMYKNAIENGFASYAEA
ncbi:McrB family protein [Gillisia sp. CAL575]|uniref:McrB family protein n=1 Tax=Gillisia sp. CAL575 TaxID=985255 RepID=UPI0003A3E2A7|nr:DUF3578 domain-containing protein [Gillisia sp. CAL575]